MPTPPHPPEPGEPTEAEGRPVGGHTIVRPGDAYGPARFDSADEPHFAPPRHPGEVGALDRYRVLKKLGQGGMGAVYLGYDGELERAVALKVMLLKEAADVNAHTRFLREARAAAKVRSKHVVTIYDVGESRGSPFIAMEYLLGHSLDQFLKSGRELSLAQAVRVGRETALGLAAVHKLGLVHRDVTPNNIWLEAPNGHVKLLDFGLARPVIDDANLSGRGSALGTPAYMSPEQARNDKALDRRTDLFSLGVVLYRLVTGQMPFTGDTALAVGTSILTDTPKRVRAWRPDVPEALEVVIDRLLAKNPAGRFRTAEEVAGALRAIEHPPADGPPLVVIPLAIEAQEQNVWEGIDASAFAPAPSNGAGGTRALKPALVAGTLLLVACAVLAAVIFRPWERVAQTPPEESLPKPVVKPVDRPPPKPEPDPDRRGAEYVLTAGGTVRVSGEDRSIKTAAALPKDAFRLTAANLSGAPAAHVRAADLAAFSGCKHLTFLDLNSSKQVTDAGLAHFRECTGLTSLGLNGTQVSNAGLAEFKRCTALTQLALSGTPVTDAGLAHLKDCTRLADINLNYTRVTDAGLAHLKDRDMTHLNLAGMAKLTDDGLAHFKGCKNLVHLDLASSPVGDAGVEFLKGCKKLAELRLTGTKVTAKCVAELRQALPQCNIVHSGATGPKQ